MSRVLAIAFATVVISTPVLAQTRVMTTHEQTGTALTCLLDHNTKDCKIRFVAGATRPAQPWLFWNANRDNTFGHLMSSEYAGTEPQNVYTMRFAHERSVDVYDVKFERQELTFYIVPPDTDGDVHYLQIRPGAPNDEKIYRFDSSPG